MCGCFFLLFYRQCHRSSLSRHRHESGHDRRKLDGKKIKSISKVVRKLKKTQESNFLHISKVKRKKAWRHLWFGGKFISTSRPTFQLCVRNMQWSRLEVSSWGFFLWPKWVFLCGICRFGNDWIKWLNAYYKGSYIYPLYWIQKKAQLVSYFLLHYFLQVSRELFMGIIIVVASILSLLLL